MKHQHGLLVTPCNQVSFTGFCPAKPEDFSHRTQQAAHPHGHSHTKQVALTSYSMHLACRYVTHYFNTHYFKATGYLDHKPHHCFPHFIAVQMALSHFLVIVQKILTNKYLLLFSPPTIYRWKNPKYKFLLLLDRL